MSNQKTKNIVIDCENMMAPHTLPKSLNYDQTSSDNPYMEPELMAEPKMALFLLPGENQDIRVDVNNLLSNGNAWLATPNIDFGGRAPEAVIGTSDEALLRDVLRSAIFTGMA